MCDKKATTTDQLELEWFQVALKTYFWFGAACALVFLSSVGALVQVQRVYDKSLVLSRQNEKTEIDCNKTLSEIKSERRRIESIWFDARRMLQEIEESIEPEPAEELARR